jgi:DNA-directed RNA polymerases I, II, and III subunit RPABC1
MDLATFRSHYANNAGSVECVHVLCLYREFNLTPCSRSQLNFFTNHQNNPMEQIFVFFTEEKSVGVKTMRKYVSRHYKDT